MPHIILKMFPGRSEEMKRKVTEKLVKAVMEGLEADESSISVSIEEISKSLWIEKVYDPEIIGKQKNLYKKPGYKPQDIK